MTGSYEREAEVAAKKLTTDTVLIQCFVSTDAKKTGAVRSEKHSAITIRGEYSHRNILPFT